MAEEKDNVVDLEKRRMGNHKETVTLEEYAAAVAKLTALARQDTSGSRIAAQVLLSAYNGFDYQLDVAGLGSLDRGNFEAAMIVVRGRYETAAEPHTMIENGGRVFQALAQQWRRLHVKERGKAYCPRCDGRGRVYANDDDQEGITCTYCDGDGRVCQCRA